MLFLLRCLRFLVLRTVLVLCQTDVWRHRQYKRDRSGRIIETQCEIFVTERSIEDGRTNVILSAEEEAKLLKPIDEYVGKIQEQIDALRVEGSDKVNSLKNQIAIAKENKNLTKEEQTKIIEECKKSLEKAKATEDANKQQIAN